MSERTSHFYVERGLEEFTASGFVSESLCAVSTRVENSLFALKQFHETLSKCVSLNVDANVDILECKQQLPEHAVLKVLYQESYKLIQLSGNLGKIMQLYANALSEIIDAFAQFKLHVGQKLLRAGLTYAEKLHSVEGMKSNLRTSIQQLNDMKPSANTSAETEKIQQNEYNEANYKFDDYRDTFSTEVYTLKSQQADMAGLFVIMLESQLDCYQTACKALREAIPGVQNEIEKLQCRPIFGEQLQQKVSPVIEVCCCTLAELALKQEGIFRVNGSARKITRLKATFNAGEFDFAGLESDPHAFASCLKLYLRELPEALMMQSLFNEWMTTIRIDSKNERIQAVDKILKKAPQAHFENLRYLIKFLKLVADSSDANKMTPKNLAIVIAPSMLWPRDSAAKSFDSRVVDAVEFMITNADAFFPGVISFKSSLTEAFLKSQREKLNPGGDSSSPIGFRKPMRKAPPRPEPPLLIKNDGSSSSLTGPTQTLPSVTKNWSNNGQQVRSKFPDTPDKPVAPNEGHPNKQANAIPLSDELIKQPPQLRRVKTSPSRIVPEIESIAKPVDSPESPKRPPRHRAVDIAILRFNGQSSTSSDICPESGKEYGSS